MYWPPHVSDTDRDTALDRIYRRHRRDDNNYISLLSRDPLEVLTYLRKIGVRRLTGDNDSHDIEDALVLRIWLWQQGEEHELWLLEAAESLRLPRRRIGPILGVSTSQGFVNRIAAKRQRLRANHTDQQTPVEQAPVPADPRQRWVATHLATIQEVAKILVDHWDLVDGHTEATDWLEDVRADLRDDQVTPGTVVAIDYAGAGMLQVPAVADLPANHPLSAAITKWIELKKTWP
jgi:hypothetical protein